MVYVGTEEKKVVALRARTGSKVWSFATGLPIDSSPAVANGVVYIGSNDGNLYALNGSTGALLWSSPTGGDSSPAVVSGVVYIASGNHTYAFNLKQGDKKTVPSRLH
jgi:outer membrane protein assembly factor BamB